MKILMVGNSFSLCVGKNLPQIVHSAGDELLLGSAYIGGCTLETHWNNIQEADANPEHRPYSFNLWKADKNATGDKWDCERLANVNELLLLEDWDVVTIQQGSASSWNYDTYQPFAQYLIERIKKNVPNARIVVQQTWAYREDDSRFPKSLFFNEMNHWDFDQTGMYERLTDAYKKLAKTNNFPIIPTGYAVQLFREQTPVHFTQFTKAQKDALVYPQVLPHDGDPVGWVYWHRNNEDEPYFLIHDPNHLNEVGEYLQACVWFLKLYGEPVDKITYVPEWMDIKTASFCRALAHQAVSQFSED